MLHKSGNKGFTLAETMVVIAILAVMAAIVIPRITHNIFSELKVDTTAQEIAAQARLAQRLSLSHKRNYVMRFYPSSPYTYYKIYREGEENNPVKEVKIPRELNCTASNDSFSFTALGSASTNATISIDNGEVQRNILVFALTGRVTLSEKQKL